jgi:predicted Rdx family selenoprotein
MKRDIKTKNKIMRITGLSLSPNKRESLSIYLSSFPEDLEWVSSVPGEGQEISIREETNMERERERDPGLGMEESLGQVMGGV